MVGFEHGGPWLIVVATALALGCGSDSDTPDDTMIGGTDNAAADADSWSPDDGGSSDGADDTSDDPDSDPGLPPGGTGDPPDNPPPPDDTSGEPPMDGTCLPTPTRMIVLGDSIAACQGVGGKDSPDCAPKAFHSIYSESFAPTTYENIAVSGSKTADVANQQLGAVDLSTPGHAFVVIYVGGNDLSPFLLLPDQAAANQFENLSTELASHWNQIFAFFGDAAKFPDGVTLLVNSQYDPFDGCTAAPYNVSQTKLGLLVQYNEDMLARIATHDWAYVADQHAPFLGHGHHAGDGSCPFYAEESAGWMNDLIHPNAAGHANIAEVMAGVASTMYTDCAE